MVLFFQCICLIAWAFRSHVYKLKGNCSDVSCKSHVSSRYWLYEYAWTNGAVLPSSGSVTHPRKLKGVPLNWSLMCTDSPVAERYKSQILVDVHSGLHHFIKLVPLIWQYFVGRMKVNAWTYYVTVYFHLANILCTFSSDICDSKSLQNIASFTKYSRMKGMHNSLAMNHARALLQGRRWLLEGQNKIIIYWTSPNQAT